MSRRGATPRGPSRALRCALRHRIRSFYICPCGVVFHFSLSYLYVLGAAARRGPAVRIHARAAHPVRRRRRALPIPPSLLRIPHSAEGVPGGPLRHYEETKKLALSCIFQVIYVCPCGVVFHSFVVVSIRTGRCRTSRPRPDFGRKPTRPAARRRTRLHAQGVTRRGSLSPRHLRGDRAARSTR